MTQDVFHTTIRFLLNKAQGGYFTSEQIDLMEDQAQMSIFNDYYGTFVKTEVYNSALDPFKVPYGFTNGDTLYGRLTTPATLGTNLYFTSIVTDQFNNATGWLEKKTVKMFRDNEWGDAMASRVDRPTLTNPIAREAGGGTYEFYPASPQSGAITFLRRPKAPKYSYTQTGRVITYQPSTSVDPEWRDTEIYMVVLKTLELLGVPLGSQALVQYAQQSVTSALTTPVK